MDELKDYLANNLKIKLHYKGDNTLQAELWLEDKMISVDYVHYRIKQ